MDDLIRDQQQTLENTLLSLKEAVEWQLKSAQEGSQPVVLDQQSFGRVSRIDAIQQQQMAVAGRQELQRQLKLILAAIKRIATEDYGFCLACGENIGFLRLQAQAYAPYCLPCQAERE